MKISSAAGRRPAGGWIEERVLPKSWPGNRFPVRKHCFELAVGFAGPLHLAHTILRRIIGRNQEARQILADAWFAIPPVFVFLDLGLVDGDGPLSEHSSPLVQLS